MYQEELEYYDMMHHYAVHYYYCCLLVAGCWSKVGGWKVESGEFVQKKLPPQQPPEKIAGEI
jgi:hypothetical protein